MCGVQCWVWPYPALSQTPSLDTHQTFPELTGVPLNHSTAGGITAPRVAGRQHEEMLMATKRQPSQKVKRGCQPEEEVGRGKGEEKLKRGCRGSEKGEWGWEWGQDKNCSESGMKWTWRLWQTMRGRSIHVGCIKRGIVPHTGAGGRGRGALLPVDYAGFLLPWRERNNELGESD